ncbi:hypothetical protein D3C75_1096190 [compost metagenome]
MRYAKAAACKNVRICCKLPAAALKSNLPVLQQNPAVSIRQQLVHPVGYDNNRPPLFTAETLQL